MATKPNGAAEHADIDPAQPVTLPDDGEIIYRSDDAGIPTVEPAEVGSASYASTGEYRTGRRGRKPGSKNKPRTEKQAATDLSGLLLSTHMMLAAFMHVEELELDESEAKRLGDAVNKVQALYDMPIIDPKVMAWINLGLVGCGVYGPRYAAFRIRKRKEKTAKPQTIDAQPIKVM